METKHYTLEDRPKFVNNDLVDVDFGCVYKGGRIISGFIVGKVVDGLLDVWLVNFEWPLNELLPDSNYNFPVCGIPHTFFVKER